MCGEVTASLHQNTTRYLRCLTLNRITLPRRALWSASRGSSRMCAGRSLRTLGSWGRTCRSATVRCLPFISLQSDDGSGFGETISTKAHGCWGCTCRSSKVRGIPFFSARHRWEAHGQVTEDTTLLAPHLHEANGAVSLYRPRLHITTVRCLCVIPLCTSQRCGVFASSHFCASITSPHVGR